MYLDFKYLDHHSVTLIHPSISGSLHDMIDKYLQYFSLMPNIFFTVSLSCIHIKKNSVHSFVQSLSCSIYLLARRDVAITGKKMEDNSSRNIVLLGDYHRHESPSCIDNFTLNKLLVAVYLSTLGRSWLVSLYHLR